PGAGAQRRGLRRALRADPGGLGPVPLQAHAAGDGQRAQRHRPEPGGAPPAPRRADRRLRCAGPAGPAALRLSASILRTMAFPHTRLRRLRQSGVLRELVRETELRASQLVYPLFVEHGLDRRTPIEAMPGVDRLSINHAVEEAAEAAGLGVPAVLLFGIPA